MSVSPADRALQLADNGCEEDLLAATGALQALCTVHGAVRLEAASQALEGAALMAMRELTCACLARGGTESDDAWLVDCTEALMEVRGEGGSTCHVQCIGCQHFIQSNAIQCNTVSLIVYAVTMSLYYSTEYGDVRNTFSVCNSQAWSVLVQPDLSQAQSSCSAAVAGAGVHVFTSLVESSLKSAAESALEVRLSRGLAIDGAAAVFGVEQHIMV